MTPLAVRVPAVKAELARRLLATGNADDVRVLAPALAALVAATADLTTEDLMAFEKFRARHHWRLNCAQWRHGGSKRYAALAAERQSARRVTGNPDRVERAWQLAREQHSSFAEAYASLGDE